MKNPIKDGTQGLAPSNYLAIESDVYDLPKKHFDMDNLYDQLPCRRDSPEQPYDILPNRKIEDVYDLPRAIVKPDTSDEDYDELPVRRVGFDILDYLKFSTYIGVGNMLKRFIEMISHFL